MAADVKSPAAQADLAAGEDVTQRLARFVVESRPGEVDSSLREEAQKSVLDWLGCALGGSRHEAVDIAVAALRELGADSGRAGLIGRTEAVSPLNAALVNGISSSVLDFSATQGTRTNIHPSEPIFPALLAVAHMRAVRGADFIDAYILGVEVACRIASHIFATDNPGWHVTSVCGGLGAAAAAGRVLGLSVEQMVSAFGIAAGQASGLRIMFGGMTKNFASGRAAQSGLLAAVLALRGFSSADRPIEGRFGLAEALMRRRPPSAMLDGLGTEFAIRATAYKPFACAVVAHAAIDACLKLRSRRRPALDAVRKVTVVVNPLAITLAGKPHPSDGLEAKFSLPHLAALALRRGTISHRDFAQARVLDREVNALRAKISCEADSSLAKDQAVVTLEFCDGATISERVEHARGSLANPLSSEDLAAKFRDLAEDILGPESAGALLAQCRDFSALADVTEFFAAARPTIAARPSRAAREPAADPKS